MIKKIDSYIYLLGETFKTFAFARSLMERLKNELEERMAGIKETYDEGKEPDDIIYILLFMIHENVTSQIGFIDNSLLELTNGERCQQTTEKLDTKS